MFKKKVSTGEVVKKYNMLKKEIGLYQMHVRNIMSSIDKKISSFKDKIEFYKSRNELTFASIYVKEINNLNVIKNILKSVDLGLLAVNLRLGTMKVVVASLIDFRDVAKVIDGVIKDARAMSDSFDKYFKLFVDDYIDVESAVNIPDVNLAAFLMIQEEDALKIIRAVERKVGEELSKKFPNVPSNLDQILSDDPKKGVRKLYEMLATDGGYYELPPMAMKYLGENRVKQLKNSILKVNLKKLRKLNLNKLDRLETTILKYIVSVRKGEFTYMDIYRLAKVARSSPEMILGGLYNLAEMGVISFHHSM